MSGGKGGGQSTKVTIPPFIESAARENLNRAKRTAALGYLPYYGPEVAAFSPLQEQAMRATGGAAEAFGLAGPGFDPLAGMPVASEYEGGLRGYGSGDLLERTLGELKMRSPEQFRRYTALPTATPPVSYGPVPDREAGVLPPGMGGAVAGGAGTNPFLTGDRANTGVYSPIFSGMTGSFSPQMAGFSGGQNIAAQLQEMRDQINQLPAQPASSFDPSVLQGQISDLQAQGGGFAPFNPSGLQSQISALQQQMSGLQATMPGMGGATPMLAITNSAIRR